MSASNKKKARKEQDVAKLTEKQLAAQREAKKVNIYTAIFICVLVLVLVAAIAIGVKQTIANSGMREKNTVAVTVGNHQISNTELNYFFIDAVQNFYSNYGSYASMFGLDTTKPLDEQVMDPDSGMTWADNFMDSAKENAKSVYALADAANAAGFVLDPKDAAAIDDSIASIDTYATLYGYTGGDAYLKAMYGKGATKESYTAYNKLTSLASAYYNHYTEALTYDDAALRAAEAEDYDAYTSYSFNSYYLAASNYLTGGTTGEDSTVTYSDAEKEASVLASEVDAKALTAEGITSVQALDSAIAALPFNAGSTASSTANTDTLKTSLSSVYGEWVSDSARKAGDKAYFANTTTTTAEDGTSTETVNGYYVIYYIGSNDNIFPLANVRHILVKYEGGTTDETTGTTTYSDEEKATAKASAEELLAQWKSGEATEDSFAALANEKSQDGDGTTGGLYENVTPGQMVQNFNDWCFDSSRKPGDTGIVETEYGYHVMFYSADSAKTYRDYMIESNLRSADSQSWYDETTQAMTMTDGNIQYISTGLVLGGN